MSGYIGTQPVPQATQTRDTFTATAGQTSFATSGYTPGFLDIFLNGVHLVNGTDYTATNGSDVVLTSGATAGDNLEVVAYTTFQTGDFVPTSGGTFSGNVAVNGNLTVDTNTLFVDAANNSVGIGTSSITSGVKVQVQSTGGTILSIKDTTSGSGDYSNIWFGDEDAEFVGFLGYNHGSDAMTFGTNSAERMRIDASGNLLVGTTSSSAKVTITEAGTGGHLALVRSTDVIKMFPSGGQCLVSGGWSPEDDNTIDLGRSDKRWDDIYATNGTIQTSDRNEKQDIEELSDAERRVAVAAKGLLRKFRWIDAVEEKGDDARIHFGIIAQDLQAAFEAEGLDAGRYAMFISSTWWEADAVIPAVDEVLDDEGNVVTEAQPERTVTKTYETAEEAPEGAVERTRMGIRYPQLLAFIIGAM